MDEKFACPHCQQHMVIEDAPLGAAVKCPNCRNQFHLPAQPGLKRSLRSPAVWAVGIGLAGVISVSIYFWRGPGPASTPVSAHQNKALKEFVFESKTLEQWLKEGDRNQSRAVQTAFKNMGPQVVPSLIAVIQDRQLEARVRGNAAHAISYAGSKNGPEAAVLIAALKNEHNYLSASTMSALLRLEVDHATLIPLFIQKLEDSNTDTRRSAAINLGRIGPVAQEAIPGLQQLKADADQKTKEAAVTALAIIAKPKLTVSDALMARAVNSLKEAGGADRQRAQTLLKEQGIKIVPELIRQLEDTALESALRRLAAEALGYAGSKDGPEVPVLAAAVKDEDSGVRNEALSALGRLSVDPKILVPLSIAMLDDVNSGGRRRAAENLGRLGKVAQEALPALKKRVESEKTATTRGAIQNAIKRIEAG